MSKAIDVKKLEGLTQDSRAVKPGYLFAAFPGTKTDGRKYIGDAVRNGAKVILAQTGTQLPDGVKDITLVTDDNPRHCFAMLAAEFYARQPKYIAAVTGTNGKTSVVHFSEQLWTARGLKAASIGTLTGKNMTTPDPVALHKNLADLAGAGVDRVAMEASSHGLDQCRLDGVKIKAAGFTNLSRDHLDYHTDMEDYFQAKIRLFSEVMEPNGVAVLNADSDQFEKISEAARKAGHRILSYGFKGNDLKILELTPEPHGQLCRFEILGKKHDLVLPLVAGFQAMNALCALGLVMAGDMKAGDYIEALKELRGAPGRLQLVQGHPRHAAVYIDYAHTPDALETVLKALRPHTQGRLVCLFGCGGDRDKGKRPIMGEISAEYADAVIVTDDNPRSEDPDDIRRDILAGASGAREIAGRAEAIYAAISDLKEGDVLLIAGKGHEQGQIFADHTEPFDDVQQAREAIGGLKAA